ncbi:MAG: gliding motility-associated C-terminal domain-containing protein, partial [Bacteroidota bacterium]
VSDKVISLKGMLIRNTFRFSGSIETEVEADILLLPDQIIALTEDPQDVQQRYAPPGEANITEVDLPTLEASEGNVTLLFNNQVIDAFDYSDDLHSPLLETEKGVSLERLSLLVETQSNDNWTSAAQSVGFATPGYANSQNIAVLPSGPDIFTLENETFSPDSDGNEDLLILNYQTDQVGYLANLRVYDAMGRLVKSLARNNSLASEGIITWDGTNEDGAKARIGIYVIWIELFTPEGNKTVEKIPCVLAGRL